MAETTLEKATCRSYGVEVREDTAFCYNCGKPVTTPSMESTAIVSGPNGSDDATPIEKPASNLQRDLERMFRAEETPSPDKLAIAAAERKKARLSQRKPRQLVWISADETPNAVYVIITLLITAI